MWPGKGWGDVEARGGGGAGGGGGGGDGKAGELTGSCRLRGGEGKMHCSRESIFSS